MTWRERIAAARERGRFTGDDLIAATDWATCAVGECVERIGDRIRGSLMAWPVIPKVTPESWGAQAGVQFLHAVGTHKFDAAERLLDAIEDRALALKREGGV